MIKSLVALGVTVACVVVVQQASAAPTLSGRLTASIHAWERQPTDSTSTTHVRSDQLAMLKLTGLGHRNVSLHTSLRGQGDLAGDLYDRSNFRLKNLYAEWRDVAREFRLRGGRQRVYAGVANLLLDGAWASYRFARICRAEAFVGVQSPLAERRRVPTWNKNRSFGGRVITELMDRDLILAVSGVRRDRRVVRTVTSADGSGQRLDLPSREQQMLGYDVAYRLRRGLRLDHQLEYDFLQHEMSRLRVTAGLALPDARWTLDADFIHRAPVVDYNSILSVFHHGDYDEFGLRGGYELRSGQRLYGGLAHSAVEEDDSQRFNVGVRHGPLTLGYNRRTGYGGDAHGVTGSFVRAWNRTWTVRLQTGLTSYRLSEDQEDRDQSWTLALGGQARLRRNLTVDLEVQNVSQELHDRGEWVDSISNLRSYVKLSYWFSSGSDTRRVF